MLDSLAQRSCLVSCVLVMQVHAVWGLWEGLHNGVLADGTVLQLLDFRQAARVFYLLLRVVFASSSHDVDHARNSVRGENC